MRIHTIPLNIADLEGATKHMTASEFGAYVSLMLCCYQSKDNQIPNDDKRLSRMARLTLKQWLKIRPVLEEKFEVTDSFWSQKVVRQVALRILEKSQIAQANALKRHKPPHAAAEQTQSVGNAIQDTRYNIQDINPLPPFVDLELFSQFISFRKEIKKPLTPTAEKVLIQKLEKFDKQGYDVNYILRESITNRWQGVFEPKNGGKKADKTANMKDPFADLRGVA